MCLTTASAHTSEIWTDIFIQGLDIVLDFALVCEPLYFYFIFRSGGWPMILDKILNANPRLLTLLKLLIWRHLQWAKKKNGQRAKKQLSVTQELQPHQQALARQAQGSRYVQVSNAWPLHRAHHNELHYNYKVWTILLRFLFVGFLPSLLGNHDL